jgi:hypothetical protein
MLKMKKHLSAILIISLIVLSCEKTDSSNPLTKEHFTLDETYNTTSIAAYKVSESNDGTVTLSGIVQKGKGTFHPTAELKITEGKKGIVTYKVNNGNSSFSIHESTSQKSLTVEMDGLVLELASPENFLKLNASQKKEVAFAMLLLNDYKRLPEQTGRVSRIDAVDRSGQYTSVSAERCRTMTFINIASTAEEVSRLQTLEMTHWSNAHIDEYISTGQDCGQACVAGTLFCIGVCKVYYDCW